ncbi:MAG: histidine phosphatase family protein [Rhodospirillales bacterium]|nr:histidine phosphatase family protein [Rhodospirillales bacterium]
MRQLLLLRHAKAVPAKPGQPDQDRPLAPRGERDAAALRARLAALGLVPDLILVSPARRTRETLAALEPWDETPLVETVEPLYLADAPGLTATLAEVADTVRSVLVIGHNPGLHLLAAELAAGTRTEAARRIAERFPTAALAEFALPGPWSRLAGARLTRLLLPEDLAAAKPEI